MIAAGIGCCLRPLGIVMNEQHSARNLMQANFRAATQQVAMMLLSVHALRTLMVEFMRFRRRLFT